MVFGLFLIGSDTAYAGNCPNCTCSPGTPGRAEWSFDNDYSWACASRDWGDECETWCGGHEYPQGPGTINPIESPRGYVAEYEEWEYETTFFCHHMRWKHLRVVLRCTLCGQPIGYTGPDYLINEWYEHDLDESHNWVRDIKDPCKVIDVHKIWCKLCGDTIAEENFIGWSHLNYSPGFNQAQPWTGNSVTLRDCCAGHEPTIAAMTHINDNNVHALWCDHHGYVNRENCDDNVVTDLGEYAGNFFYGTPTNVQEDMSNPNGLRQDGALHVYKHRYTYNGNSLNCNLCVHYKNVGDAILIAQRTDNGSVIGLSDYNFSWDIGSWINSSVSFRHNRPPDEFNGNTRDIWQSWKLIIDGTSGGLRQLTQEGTHYPVYANEKYRRDIYREYIDHYEHWSYTDKDGNTHSGSTPVYKWKWFLGEGGYPERNTNPFPIMIDKTAPKTTPTVTIGSYKNPITKLVNEDGTFNSLGYGLKVNLNSDDRNPKAKGGQNDVSKIWLNHKFYVMDGS